MKDITESHPKSHAALVTWVGTLLKNIHKNLVEENKDAPEEVKESFTFPPIEDESKRIFADGMLRINSRALFDFFDEQGVYISLENRDGVFTYNVGKIQSGAYASRKEAELGGFEDAFNILENKLNNK